MTQESALLGVPTISIYPGKLPTALEFLRRKKLIYHFMDPVELTEAVRRMLRRIDDVKRAWKRKSEKLWRLMEDPMNVIVEELKSSSRFSP